MNPHSISLITTLLLVFASAIVGGLLAKKLKQPTLVGFIASGVLFGNVFQNFVDRTFITQIADTGVTLLLFTLGVEFSFRRLRKVLGAISWAAIAQVVISLLIFLLVFLFLGFGFLASLFIAAAAALSSTALFVKVFGEKGELDSVPGELGVGWLVIQDLTVIPLMLLLPAIVSVQGNESVTLAGTLGVISMTLFEAGIALAAVVLLGRTFIPRLLNYASGVGSREIFLLIVVGIVFLSAIITYVMGLSTALGAFIAGLLISETSQNHAIFSEIRPLRDLFAVVFFVSLGMVLPIGTVFSQLPLIVGVASFILLFKWFLVFGFTRYLGYHRKTAFIVAVSIAQMSEFGFILASMGTALGALSGAQYVFLVALAFTTMLAGTVLLSSVHALYYQFYKTLGKILPRFFSTKQEQTPNREELPYTNHIVICGYGRVGKYIGRALEMTKVPFVVVDYNQNTIAQLRERGVLVVYGDPADKDVLDYAQVDFARAIIIAIPDRHTQELIISNAQTLNKKIRIICRSHHEEDQRRLKSLGVHTIIQPEFEAALSVIERILPEFGIAVEEVAGKISRLKIEHGLG